MGHIARLRGIIARKQAARERLHRAHVSSSYTEFNAACAEWTAAFADYVNFTV